MYILYNVNVYYYLDCCLGYCVCYQYIFVDLCLEFLLSSVELFDKAKTKKQTLNLCNC